MTELVSFFINNIFTFSPSFSYILFPSFLHHSLPPPLFFSSGVTVMMNMSIETHLVKEKMASKAVDLMMYGFVSYLPLRSVLTRVVTFLFCEITCWSWVKERGLERVREKGEEMNHRGRSMDGEKERLRHWMWTRHYPTE